jgi:hypothetical protein
MWEMPQNYVDIFSLLSTHGQALLSCVAFPFSAIIWCWIFQPNMCIDYINTHLIEVRLGMWISLRVEECRLMGSRAALVGTDVSEELRFHHSVKRVRELVTTLAVTSRWRPLRRKEPHGVTYQKAPFFIVTAEKTSDLSLEDISSGGCRSSGIQLHVDVTGNVRITSGKGNNLLFVGRVVTIRNDANCFGCRRR